MQKKTSRARTRIKTDDPPGEAAPQASATCPIVGIGGSAGAIEALRAFMPAVSPDSGLAYVVVMHLSPGHKSVLAELLGRTTSLPVILIEEATRVEPNKIYVIPPNTTLTIEDAVLHLTQLSEPRGLRTPIDTFLVSLAQDQAENAACVILSGSGSDGTMGVRAIKEHGGLTLAQTDAEYDSMMRSALATGLVDVMVSAHDMPGKLTDYFRHLSAVAHKRPASALRDIADRLPQIYVLLRGRTGHDFAGYKDTTLVRRIQRRMQVLQIEKISDFVERLRKEPRELDLLFQDLLIGVTSFFRDAETFGRIKTDVIPHLLEGKRPDDTIRIWVPACATGEEAYSLAMLLREQMTDPLTSPKLQIFASDIDPHALDVARAGRYPAAIAQDVSVERLQRFFVREDGTYRISAELREICLFSLHDVLRDAPFSKLDLISCRNFLIYLKPDLQNRVIPLFHYALLEGGFLVLGSSESVTRQTRLFGTVDKAHHIFRRRHTERRLPEFPLTVPGAGPRDAARTPRPAAPDSVHALAERQILERYAPAYVVINSDGDLLLSSGRTGKYLELPAGAPNNSIYAMARRGLRIDLRAAVHRAASSGQIVTHDSVSVGTNGGRQLLNLIVQPIRQQQTPDPLYMVVFQDVGGVREESEQDRAQPVEDVESVTVQQLEAELRATRERLQTTTEELESSNEELKSSNEELSSINEELQSSNEELETSREEMQSINEELQTVNAELRSRVDELSRANNDIANLLESTQIATVFLDRELAIKSFTPAARDLFHLVDSDAGRPLRHVRPRFSPDTVQQDAERVLRTLGTIERKVQISDGDARHIMRILPYRTVDNVIGGVVLTFADVTRITAAEARIEELTRDLRDRLENLETLLDLVPVGILIVENVEGRQQVRVNRYGARIIGEHNEAKGLRQVQIPLRLLDRDRELMPEELPLQRAARTGDVSPTFDGRLVGADGSLHDVLISATPLFDERSAPRGAVAVVIDISQRKRTEAHQEFLLRELQHRVKDILATVGSLASRALETSASLEDFSTAFLGRLSAMAAIHGLLAERQWAGTALRAVAAAALSPFADATRRDIRLDGPDVTLTPTQAATLGMAVHELAANSARQGALAVDEGRVDMRWTRENPGRLLSLDWTEQNGPPVKPPRDDDFGFIKRSIARELGGTATLAPDAAGLRATIVFPLGEPAAEANSSDVSGS